MKDDLRNGFVYAGWACLLLAAVIVVAFIGACGPATSLQPAKPAPNSATKMKCVGGQLADGNEVVLCATGNGCEWALGAVEQLESIEGWTDCRQSLVELSHEEPDGGPPAE